MLAIASNSWTDVDSRRLPTVLRMRAKLSTVGNELASSSLYSINVRTLITHIYIYTNSTRIKVVASQSLVARQVGSIITSD